MQAAASSIRYDAGLQRLLARIIPALRPVAVYLFGSRATGDARADSDYDLLVVVPDDTPRERANVLFAFEVTQGSGVAADVIPCRRSVFDARKNEVGTLPYTVWHEGVRVYGG